MIPLPTSIEAIDARLSELVAEKRRATLMARRNDIDTEVDGLLAQRTRLAHH